LDGVRDVLGGGENGGKLRDVARGKARGEDIRTARNRNGAGKELLERGTGCDKILGNVAGLKLDCCLDFDLSGSAEVNDGKGVG